MSNVYITIAIPFAGKSRWTEKFVKTNPNTVVICPDEIRKTLTGDISDQTRNADVWTKTFGALANAIDAKAENIIFDATNISPRTRNQIFDVVDKPRTKAQVFYIVFPCSLEVAMERKNKDLDRIKRGLRSNVPDDIIKKFYDEFQKEIGSILVDGRADEIRVVK